MPESRFWRPHFFFRTTPLMIRRRSGGVDKSNECVCVCVCVCPNRRNNTIGRRIGVVDGPGRALMCHCVVVVCRTGACRISHASSSSSCGRCRCCCCCCRRRIRWRVIMAAAAAAVRASAATSQCRHFLAALEPPTTPPPCVRACACPGQLNQAVAAAGCSPR